MSSNRIRHTRESLMLSKAELARKAGLSALTIDRVESGRPCRLETKRRLLMALGIPLSESREAFVPLAADAPPADAAWPDARRGWREFDPARALGAGDF
ncbi:MAG: helix-turn-helix transcriptional regulator [Myxococcota bacterium]